LITLSTQLWKLPKSTSKKQNIYNILLINMTQSCQIKQRYTFHLHPVLLNNTCVQHNFKSVHVSNLFWSREYNSAKEICKYASFSKVGGNYPLDLKIIWSSAYMMLVTKYQISAINSYWEKYLGRTDRRKTVYPPPPSGSGGIKKTMVTKKKLKICYISQCTYIHK
jgi:hypothetical protein